MKRLIAVILLVGLGASTARAQQPAQEPKPSMEIYGFAMLDMGHDFKQIHPDWFDTLRVTRLPAFEDEFGKDHNTFAGVQAEPARGQDVDADESGRPQDHFRVRVVRHRRGLRPDDVPAAPCVG